MSKNKERLALLLTVVLLVLGPGASAQQKVVVVPLSVAGGDPAYIWLPAADAVVRHGDSTQAHTEIESNGRTCVEQDVSGNLLVDVLFPIQIDVPNRRYHRIKALSVFYNAPAATAFITATQIQGRNFSTGSTVTLVTDNTDRKSASFEGYRILVTANETVTALVAPTNVRVQLRMPAIGSAVCLYGVRLELE